MQYHTRCQPRHIEEVPRDLQQEGHMQYHIRCQPRHIEEAGQWNLGMEPGPRHARKGMVGLPEQLVRGNRARIIRFRETLPGTTNHDQGGHIQRSIS